MSVESDKGKNGLAYSFFWYSIFVAFYKGVGSGQTLSLLLPLSPFPRRMCPGQTNGARSALLSASVGGGWVFCTLCLARSALSFSFLPPLVTLSTYDGLSAQSDALPG